MKFETRNLDKKEFLYAAKLLQLFTLIAFYFEFFVTSGTKGTLIAILLLSITVFCAIYIYYIL